MALDDRRPARILVLAVVGAVVVGVGVLSAVLGVPAAPAPAPAPSPSAVAPAAAHTASTYCAAPTGASNGTTDYLTNTTAAGLSVTMTTAEETGPTAPRVFDVPPRGTVAVNPQQGLPPGSRGTTFAVPGGGVAVSQAIWGSLGWGMSACASSVADHWIFPSGSTAQGNSLDLALYNPTASTAMADISFLTSGGLLTPQPFQGIAVGPGQLVDEALGAYAQNLTEVATVVSVESGALVAEELSQWSSPTGQSLQLGATRAATVWRFGATPATPGGAVTFDVANPSPDPVTVTFTAALPSATVVPRAISVAGSSTATFTPSSTPGWPRQSAYSVTVESDAPVVVGRTVAAPSGAPSPGQGVTLGVAQPAARWLVPGPGIPSAPATTGGSQIRSLSVANPEAVPVHVVVTSLAHPGTLAALTVAPGQLAPLSGSQLSAAAPLVVSGDSPVVVEEDDAPTGAPGVVAWAGMPFLG
jgi:hypothetical protein